MSGSHEALSMAVQVACPLAMVELRVVSEAGFESRLGAHAVDRRG